MVLRGEAEHGGGPAGGADQPEGPASQRRRNHQAAVEERLRAVRDKNTTLWRRRGERVPKSTRAASKPKILRGTKLRDKRKMGGREDGGGDGGGLLLLTFLSEGIHLPNMRFYCSNGSFYSANSRKIVFSKADWSKLGEYVFLSDQKNSRILTPDYLAGFRYFPCFVLSCFLFFPHRTQKHTNSLSSTV